MQTKNKTDFKGPVFDSDTKTVIVRGMRCTSVIVPYNVAQEAQWRYNRHMNGVKPTYDTTN